jgi:hypothetical protein
MKPEEQLKTLDVGSTAQLYITQNLKKNFDALRAK